MSLSLIRAVLGRLLQLTPEGQLVRRNTDDVVGTLTETPFPNRRWLGEGSLPMTEKELLELQNFAKGKNWILDKAGSENNPSGFQTLKKIGGLVVHR